MIDDMSENIILIFTADGHSVFFRCISGSQPGILGDFDWWSPTIFPNSMEKSSLLSIMSTVSFILS